MHNKRGLSAIVTTLLIILLVLVAVGVVWGVVRGILRGGADDLGSSTRCLYINVEATAINCEDAEACRVILTRTGSDNDAIGGVKFVFEDATNEERSPSAIDVAGNIEKLVGLTTTQDSGVTSPSKLEVTVYLVDESGNEDPCSPVDFDIDVGVGGSGEPINPPNGGECDPACSGETPYCLIDTCVQCIETANCGVDETCTNNVCVPDDCEPEPPETTCLDLECGIHFNNCEAEVTCPPGCNPGEMCGDGICVVVDALHFGEVQEVWPGDSGMYFASSDLPDHDNPDYVDYTYSELSYTGATDCVTIANYVTTDISGYTIPHIAFNFETSIIVGNTYYIWYTSDECIASLGA